MRIVSTLVAIWLIIGVIAAFQRDYFANINTDAKCGEVGTILVTIAAGPLNYFGANPKVDCKTPEPSK
jgi:hypothetical protein